MRVAIGTFVAVAVSGLVWAKWWPYVHKTVTISETDTWPGSDLFSVDGRRRGSAVAQTWDFATAYVRAIWPALVTSLAMAGCLALLLPRTALCSVRGLRPGWGVAAALPTMMCTCCAAPFAATLRARGASRRTAAAWWLANPLLNPAVLVFLALLFPWQIVAVRLGAGVFVVGLVTQVLLARAAESGQVVPAPVETDRPRRYWAAAVAVLAVEIAGVVFLVGLLQAWLHPFDGLADASAVTLVAVVVAATLAVIPTGGEIPVVLALFAVGAGPVVIGVVLVALPALSLPSGLVMRGALGDRGLLATASAVMGTAVLAGLALLALDVPG